MDSHIWLFSHRNRSNYAYGDFFAWAQVDFYRGPIAAELSYFPKKTTYRSLWSTANGTEGQALILLLDHNTDTGVMLIESKYYWKNLTVIDPVLGASHRVYTTGETAIYRSTERSTAEHLDFERPVPTNVTNASTIHALANGTAGENATGGQNSTDAGNATDDAENPTLDDGNRTTTADEERRAPPPSPETPLAAKPRTTPDPNPRTTPTVSTGTAEFVAARDEFGQLDK